MLFSLSLRVAVLLMGLHAGNTAPEPHPFYVSVTELNHNATEKSFEITSKMFAEDIEQSIEKISGKVLSITDAKDKDMFDKYLPEYFAKHFSVFVNGKILQVRYLGFEVEKESAYCYLEISGITAAQSISINNSLLYDFNENEINIMHVTVAGKRISQKVNYPESVANFNF